MGSTTDDELPPLTSRSGMLPPDGAHWPPLPTRPEPAAAPAPVHLPGTARRPEGSEVEDWRTMPFDGPEGYRGSASAPVPTPRWDSWCIAALAFGVIGVAALWFPVASPFPAVLGVGFGLIGRRATSLDPSLKGRWMATLGIVAAVAIPVVLGLRLATGNL